MRAALLLFTAACTFRVEPMEHSPPPPPIFVPPPPPPPGKPELLPARIADPGPLALAPTPVCLGARALPEWGARIAGDRLSVRVRSHAATRMVLELFEQPRFAGSVATFVLDQEGDVFHAELARAELPASARYYGLRAWGPNWPYDPTWTPGSSAGLIARVDAAGNRFNPNKLLFDPYALEISHDPIGPDWTDGSVYRSDDANLARDSAPYAPKGIILPVPQLPCGSRPDRPLAESIIYEVHVRGFTMADPSVREEWRGTYRGAAEKAEYLASIGVTAIELLPIQETQNDQNDIEVGTNGDNYWGYSSLSFFAPDRRYAFDRSPGGPTRELAEMVRAFHARGIEVYLDVVYNHTGEDGHASWRGIDNAAYYELSQDGQGYASHNGVGPNFNTKDPITRDLVIDSLRYLHVELGIDGFRFDLAPVVGNGCERACYRFDRDDPEGVLRRATTVGAKLIAEPWGIGAGTYQLGNFPPGWSEWNGSFRDAIRRDQNALGVEAVAPADLARRLLGSPDLFSDDGRDASAAINYVVSHDGFTLRDLYSYASKVNDRPWPNGPSSGGDDNNLSWDHGGDPTAQRQAARTGFALLMFSAGAPMITGGDEMFRTQLGNNNPYNLDSPAIWLDWSEAERHPAFFDFTRAIMLLRHQFPALRSANAELLDDDGQIAGAQYLSDPTRHFLGIRRGDTYVAYNGWSGSVSVQLPDPGAGRVWTRIVDTAAFMEVENNHRDVEEGAPIANRIYDVFPRSLALFIDVEQR